MSPLAFTLALFGGLVVSAASDSPTADCKLSFDGRVPLSSTPETFSSEQSLFNPKYVIGQNLTWAKIIEFPEITPSRFDIPAQAKPLGLTLTDESTFLSGSEGVETALRRTELLVNNKNNTVSGHKTWHFSFRTDPSRPLNYSHEYLLAFHEAADFQADFWSVKVGALLEGPAVPSQNLRVEGYKWDTPVKRFFEAPLVDAVWHNMGINLDFDNNMISVLYSIDNAPLEVVVPPTFNNISGKAPTTLGETHFGLQKRPTGANLENFLFEGYQEKGINEAFFFGGIFQDDSSTGCVTL
ncbi:hypothetical protein Micbo1qcDRAFT_200507 [Microdochium bolleyi]|uniref:Glycoside hydrolase 131 catalytic N-terminal domain-containing protein n=1 Tax=Microdochium bolleyi TaxID=196109 RepID=A0A136JD28_9PEZI|nr:hypothetical protein Micbo1qcDRAFT_200507 [Microdochium bolleyi]